MSKDNDKSIAEAFVGIENLDRRSLTGIGNLKPQPTQPNKPQNPTGSSGQASGKDPKKN